MTSSQAEIVETGEDRVGVVAEAVDQLRIEVRAPTLLRHGERRPRPAEWWNASTVSARCTSRMAGARSSWPPGRACPRRPSARTPAAAACRPRAQAETVGELARRLAVCLHHRLHRAARRRRGTCRPCRPAAALERPDRGAGRRTPPWPRRPGRHRGCRRTARVSSPNSCGELAGVGGAATQVSSDV